MERNKVRKFFGWVYLAVLVVLAYLLVDQAAEFANAYRLEGAMPLLLHIVLSSAFSGVLVSVPVFAHIVWNRWRRQLYGEMAVAIVAILACLFFLYLFFSV